MNSIESAYNRAMALGTIGYARPRGESFEDDSVQYTANVFDIWSLARTITIRRDAESTSAAVDLMKHGFLAKSPSRPTVAISLKTLQLLYRLRQRKASFSIEAFAKVLCDYYQVRPLYIRYFGIYTDYTYLQIPFRRHLREIVADTFEVFLRILRRVEARVNAVLGWDSNEWRVKNECRACCYKVHTVLLLDGCSR